MTEQRLTPSDFEALWGENLSAWVTSRIAARDMRYLALLPEQRDQAIKKVMKELLSEVERSGRHRSQDWEYGWSENLSAFKAANEVDKLIPKYFNKYPIVRLKQELFHASTPTLEFDLFATLLDWILDTRIPSNCGALYEFGCGTGHNLLRVRERFPNMKLTGLDWATSSQELLQEYALKVADPNIFAENFDYFNPDESVVLDPRSCVLTVASLEQVGNRYTPFISYLCAQRPELVIHIEPIGELLDSSNLLDYLSLEYFKKRNYLNGLLDELRILESQGRVELLEARRTFIGSFFIDGYSLVVWRPTPEF